jgi:hypothetical protein
MPTISPDPFHLSETARVDHSRTERLIGNYGKKNSTTARGNISNFDQRSRNPVRNPCHYCNNFREVIMSDQGSKKTVIETTQVHTPAKGRTVTTSRFVRRIVYTTREGEQYIKHMGEHLPVEPHPILGTPRYVIRKTL